MGARFSRGFTFLASYAFSKLIDDVGGAFAGEATAATGVQNWYDLRSERSISPFDQTQSLVISYIWEVPFGKGHGIKQLFEGWQMQGVTSFQSGPALGIAQGNNTVFAQTGIQRPNWNGRNPRLGGAATVDRWFDTSFFTAPPPYTFGSSPRFQVPDTNSSSSGFRRASVQINKPRTIQFGMKLIF